VRTVGWRLRPTPCKSRLQQVDGVEQPVGEAPYRVQTRTRGTLPAQAESERTVSLSYVVAVDHEKRPCAPVHPGRARHLLNRGRVAVWRLYPFTIILKPGEQADEPAPLRLKIDPGSKTTGFALVYDETGQVMWAAELTHRGQQVKARLDQRRACRRSRRQRHTRYRQPRFDNRRRRAGWLPPSLESRIANTVTWVERLRQWCPIGALSLELVKFDMQLMQNAEISGIEYQQGALARYEIREYLLGAT
jgi:hypothetical protein